MILLKNLYSEVLEEALKLSIGKLYSSLDISFRENLLEPVWKNLTKKADSISKKGDRLYFRLYNRSNSQELKIEKSFDAIILYLCQELGECKTEPVSKIDGTIYYKNRVLKIRKYIDILTKESDEKVKNTLLLKLAEYNTLKTKLGVTKEKHFYIVISKHPYDVAGMSTGRGWSSCMNLYTGKNKDYIYCDIERGTFIAYLIKTSDPNLSNPLGRVLIKPFYDKQGVLAFGVDQVLPSTLPSVFLDTVEDLIKNAQESLKHLPYYLDPALYDDGTRIITNPEYINTFKVDLLEQEKQFQAGNISRVNIKDGLFMNLNLRDLKLDNSRLSHANFNRAYLRNITFQNAELPYVVFSRANLDTINFSDATLSFSSFTYTTHVNVDFTGCNLQTSRFIAADLGNANFKNADIGGAKFHEADLSQVRNLETCKNLDYMLYDDLTIFPIGFKKPLNIRR